MLFNSTEFVFLFLPATLLFYYFAASLGRPRLPQIVLLLPEKFAMWVSQFSFVDTEQMLAWGGETLVTHRQWRILGVLLAGVLFLPNSQELQQRFRPGRLTGALTGAVLAGCVLNFHRVSEFLYFQF